MSAANSPRNRVRIIGGDWRSRQLQFPSAPGLRPTPDRVRETLFNWLQVPVIGAQCLDLFAGSGALGFEALSRGAAQVTALETDTAAVSALRSNAKLLGTDRLQVLQQNALHYLTQAPTKQFTLIFLDPPFDANLHERCLQLLAEQAWLAPRARVYVEAGMPLSSLQLPAGWKLSRDKRAGDVHYGLLEVAGNAQSL